MTWIFEVTSKLVPISINSAYTVFHGRKHLTSEGRKFKAQLKERVSREAGEWKTAHDLVYQYGKGVTLVITLGFPDLHNKSWKQGKLTRTYGGKPRSRYKKKDSSNYIKLIEDAVSEGSGIDDCNFVQTTVRKVYSEEGHITIRMEIED